MPRPEAAKLLSFGYEQLLADCWWLAFIQYYGDTYAREHGDHYGSSHSFLDLITSLDPKFTEPYWFTAFAVGSEERQPQLAGKLIDRGVMANPDNWYLPFIAGINQYLFCHNDQAAAKFYRRAARYPDAPAWLLRQSEILESGVPSLIKDTVTWQAIYHSAGEPRVRDKARAKLIKIWTAVYRTASIKKIRDRAKIELEGLGVDAGKKS